MSPRPHGRPALAAAATPRQDTERGAVLVLAILSLLMVSALVAGLATSGRTDLLVSQNQERATQSRAAAEAGLNHASELVISNLRSWEANGFADASAAMTSLLQGPDGLTGTTDDDADNGSLEGLGIPRLPAMTVLAANTATAYNAWVLDEDDPARGFTLSADDQTRIGEDGNAVIDGNTRLLVRASGFARGATMTTLEASISPVAMPAIVTNGDLTISGNATVSGQNGGVHSNSNLTLGGSVSIAQACTASSTQSTSGNPTCGGLDAGDQPVIPVPPIAASDYLAQTDLILTAGGVMVDQSATVICDASGDNDACEAAYGWVYEGADGWRISSNSAADGSYYVEGNARVSGSPGTPADPVSMTIIAEGSIEISGNPDFAADMPGVLFVTDQDLKISGNLDMPAIPEALILVHEQISITGNPTLAGQILVEDAASVSTLVTSNQVSGNVTCISELAAEAVNFQISAWREIR